MLSATWKLEENWERWSHGDCGVWMTLVNCIYEVVSYWTARRLASSLIFLGCKANAYGPHPTRGEYEQSQYNLHYEAQGRVGIGGRMKPHPKDETGN
jgi:hypothetical protein